MNSIVKLVFNEFATQVISKFDLDTTPEALYEIWRANVKAMKISVSFGSGKSVVASEEETEDQEAVVVKTQEPSAPVKKSQSKTCPYRSVRGDTKGTVCGKNSTKDCIMCSAHKKHADKYLRVSADEESPDEAPAVSQKKTCTCTYILTRGDRNGNACGNKTTAGEFCAKHSDAKEKKTSAVPKGKGSEPVANSQPIKLAAKRDSAGRVVLKGENALVIKSVLEPIVLGKVVNDKMSPLNADDLEFCKKNRLGVDPSLSKKSIEEVIETITGGEDDEEDEEEDGDESE